MATASDQGDAATPARELRVCPWCGRAHRFWPSFLDDGDPWDNDDDPWDNDDDPWENYDPWKNDDSAVRPLPFSSAIFSSPMLERIRAIMMGSDNDDDSDQDPEDLQLPRMSIFGLTELDHYGDLLQPSSPLSAFYLDEASAPAQPPSPRQRLWQNLDRLAEMRRRRERTSLKTKLGPLASASIGNRGRVPRPTSGDVATRRWKEHGGVPAATRRGPIRASFGPIRGKKMPRRQRLTRHVKPGFVESHRSPNSRSVSPSFSTIWSVSTTSNPSSHPIQRRPNGSSPVRITSRRSPTTLNADHRGTSPSVADAGSRLSSWGDNVDDVERVRGETVRNGGRDGGGWRGRFMTNDTMPTSTGQEHATGSPRPQHAPPGEASRTSLVDNFNTAYGQVATPGVWDAGAPREIHRPASDGRQPFQRSLHRAWSTRVRQKPQVRIPTHLILRDSQHVLSRQDILLVRRLESLRLHRNPRSHSRGQGFAASFLCLPSQVFREGPHVQPCCQELLSVSTHRRRCCGRHISCWSRGRRRASATTYGRAVFLRPCQPP
ncbi:hypothetical protein QBC34DRAFT_152761 [Podospora aff. communis PSN243]|uniref:Uncharacterized protein n=1 Tax=Podospora aff. communis PSN243 TaxID=3040156 RepID=A0AAV9GFI0_9PEZI|nr:hypothetical protein QBC34DRAFT_152761 [Podospora aff. communis PSN243]